MLSINLLRTESTEIGRKLERKYLELSSGYIPPVREYFASVRDFGHTR